MTDKELLITIMPNWQTDPIYTEQMFLKGSKDKTIKAAMSNARVVYTKYSKKTAGCFCHKGIRIILEWLIKRVKLEEENKTNENENKNI